MLKQLIILVLLSIIIILTMPYVQHGLHFLLASYHWISNLLAPIFSGGEAGNIIKKLIALLAVPIIVSFIVAFLYWIVKRSWFPYFIDIVWVLWLIQTTALVVQYSIT